VTPDRGVSSCLLGLLWIIVGSSRGCQRGGRVEEVVDHVPCGV